MSKIRLIGVRFIYEDYIYFEKELKGESLSDKKTIEQMKKLYGFNLLSIEQRIKYKLDRVEDDVYSRKILKSVEITWYDSANLTLKSVSIPIYTDEYNIESIEFNSHIRNRFKEIGVNIDVDIYNYNKTFREIDIKGLEVTTEMWALQKKGDFNEVTKSVYDLDFGYETGLEKLLMAYDRCEELNADEIISIFNLSFEDVVTKII